MGRHSEWRKIAKKYRRKRIRSEFALKRDEALQKEQEKRENSPTYQAWVKEQEVLELFRKVEEERQAQERRKQWEEEEKAATVRWKEQQVRLAQARAEKIKQEMLIREEWEREQKKLKDAEEEKKKIALEKKKREEEILSRIEAFISGHGQFPSEANISTETQPGHEVCPFFSKTGACRFKDNCSRNHIRPGISKILLIPNFYDHLGIQSLHQNEYDTDIGLEYEDSETYQHFLEFYNDVLPEFEVCGHVTQFRVCCNEEPHLRGNVYVEFSKERHAMKAYRQFQGRYYAGRQLSVEFCSIRSWKNAICGLYHIKKCPKGKNCNFMHVFWNPRKQSNGEHSPSSQRHSRSRSPSQRRRIKKDNWKWSDSSDSENESWTRRSRSRGRASVSSRSSERHRRTHPSRQKDHRKRKRSRSVDKEKEESRHSRPSSTRSSRDKNRLKNVKKVNGKSKTKKTKGQD